MWSGVSLRQANGVRYLSGATRGERRGTASGIDRRQCPWLPVVASTETWRGGRGRGKDTSNHEDDI